MAIIKAQDLNQDTEISLEFLTQHIPFVEAERANGELAADTFKNHQPPRFMKTHLSYELWKCKE